MNFNGIVESNMETYKEIKQNDNGTVHIGGYATGKDYTFNSWTGTLTSDDGDQYKENSWGGYHNEKTGETIW